MRMNRSSRLVLRIQGLVFILAFMTVLVLIAWLSTRFVIATNWSDAGRTALSESSVRLLERLDEPVDVVVFVRPDDVLADHMQDLVRRYQDHKADFRYRVVNPDARPDLVRDFGVEGSGELILEYRGRQERVRAPSEPRISAALERIHRSDTRPIVYMSGHGERDLLGKANHDLGSFGQYLMDRGHRLQPARPGDTLPRDAALVVVAGPRSDWMSGTRRELTEYLDQGGNLLWLVDDQDERRLGFLAEHLAIELVPGVVVEPRAEELLGVDNPRLLVLGDYPGHVALRELGGVSLFNAARALDHAGDNDWNPAPLLVTEERHWSETGNPDSPGFDAGDGDTRGPLVVGLSLDRPLPGDDSRAEGEQRVAVIGDADFLSNAYLGNGENLKLGLKLVDWLSAGDGIVDIHGRAAPDQRLHMGERRLLATGLGFLVALPVLSLLVAGGLWWRRRRA